MGFNCAQEKAKFDREWLRLRKEYTDAGMSEAAIQKIYDYDWYCFCRNRAYERRATQMPPLEIDSPDDARRSALFRKNETLSVSFDESAFPDRYAWVDTLEDLRLLQAIKTLSIEELEILTFLTLEEHSQKERAERWGCSQRAMKLKEAAKKVEDGIEETLTYCDFPSEHWTRIRTNNVIERLYREIRRRTRVVGTFPDGNSALMLVCARLRHVAGTQWGSKKYMNMKHLEAALDDASIAG